MKPCNCIESIAVLMCKKVSTNSFKNKLQILFECANKWLIVNRFIQIR